LILLIFIIDRDEDGVWIVECPRIPGCVSQGETKDQALANIQDAIIACFQVRRDNVRRDRTIQEQIALESLNAEIAQLIYDSRTNAGLTQQPANLIHVE
jgi:predicted RNase H-like HicB family nuclease